jgi:putative transposase
MELTKEGFHVLHMVKGHTAQYNISDATYYNWKTKYYGMEISELRRLKQLEDENRKLKQLVADQALDIQGLKHIVSKKY